MSRIAAVFLMFLIFGCAPDKTINELSKQDQNTLIGFQRLPKSHVLEITDEKEPGEKLVLCITFVGKENKTPLANQLVRFYHTTASGNYEPISPGDESTARTAIYRNYTARELCKFW